MRNMKRKKIIGILFAMAVYTIFIIYLSQFIGFDSDKANHILQAQDILHGNFWFKDWNLTGITFFTTDLLFYELAVLVSGEIGYRTAYIAYGLMSSSVVILSLLAVLIQIHENRKQRILLFSFLFAVPCMSYLGWLRIHSGAVCWSIVAVLITADILKSENTDVITKTSIGKYIFLCLSLLLGTIGDMLTAVEGAFPILIYCIITMLNTPEKHSLKSDKRLYVILSSFIAIVGAVVIDKIYFAVGGANRNSYIGDKSFSSVSEWHDKLWSFVSNLLLMGDAGFMDGRLNDIWNYTRIINGAIIVVAVIMILGKLWGMIRGKSHDIVSAILSISFIMIACAYIFTDKSSPIYMTMEPVICFIVLLREYENLILFMKNRRLWTILLYVLAGVSFAGKIESITLYNYPEEVLKYKRLVSFLDEHDLHYGYASFWNASVFTVISNNDVRIRHLIDDGRNRFIMYNWFNKNEWYLEDTNFILVENSNNDRGASDSYHLSEENIINYFGIPNETYEQEDYIVMVYDHTLSNYLTGIGDGKIIPFEMYCNEKVDVMGDGIDKVFRLGKGGSVFGPYVRIDPGEYTIVFEGERLGKARTDVFSYEEMQKDLDRDYRTKNNISYQLVSQTDDKIVVDFKVVRKKVEGVEFRLFCDYDEDVRLDQILIKKVK